MVSLNPRVLTMAAGRAAWENPGKEEGLGTLGYLGVSSSHCLVQEGPFPTPRTLAWWTWLPLALAAASANI